MGKNVQNSLVIVCHFYVYVRSGLRQVTFFKLSSTISLYYMHLCLLCFLKYMYALFHFSMLHENKDGNGLKLRCAVKQ